MSFQELAPEPNLIKHIPRVFGFRVHYAWKNQPRDNSSDVNVPHTEVVNRSSTGHIRRRVFIGDNPDEDASENTKVQELASVVKSSAFSSDGMGVKDSHVCVPEEAAAGSDSALRSRRSVGTDSGNNSSGPLVGTKRNQIEVSNDDPTHTYPRLQQVSVLTTIEGSASVSKRKNKTSG